MDAREYMARKGLDGERDQERPNTLEEKAWSRAREAGEQPPRAGTPFDWEEWERYHETLAEGAEELDQKIDHEAHRQALEHGSREAVGHFTPAAGDQVRVDREQTSPAPPESEAAAAEPRLALHALAVLLPPLGVGLSRGGGARVMVSLVLTLLGWLPGVVHALWWLRHSRR
ncbi:YqaE/Pmp3 family membrane protein [Halomonas lysinitropha]|uniref:Proteolipid membrane potential modulator n=1 Tax=Halomonas lysinitropha TaxID=2607506 RepID=A0A5K1I6C2_9GAMM|nr:YqaE/Pmp3 family membrane protein [Halomonas lysinitropha]VVZ95603.1 Proteolipid membrane potential modulator [Halomonas lysinitropha]